MSQWFAIVTVQVILDGGVLHAQTWRGVLAADDEAQCYESALTAVFDMIESGGKVIPDRDSFITMFFRAVIR